MVLKVQQPLETEGEQSDMEEDQEGRIFAEVAKSPLDP
jgi:hypothetical protein